MVFFCDLSSWPGHWKCSRASEKVTRASEIFIRLLRATAPWASEKNTNFAHNTPVESAIRNVIGVL